jgi:hypothetical protein
MLTVPSSVTCLGTGRRWMGGTNSPICPVCHRGWRSPVFSGVTKRPPIGKATALVPSHERRTL